MRSAVPRRLLRSHSNAPAHMAGASPAEWESVAAVAAECVNSNLENAVRRVCGGNWGKGKRKVLADWRILARRRAGPTPAAGRVVGTAGRVVQLPLPPVAYDACDKPAG